MRSLRLVEAVVNHDVVRRCFEKVHAVLVTLSLDSAGSFGDCHKKSQLKSKYRYERIHDSAWTVRLIKLPHINQNNYTRHKT